MNNGSNTTIDNISSVGHCTELGSHSFLQKPAETEELLNVLKEAYQKRIQRKLELEEGKMQDLLKRAAGESPMGVLRLLKKIDKERI